MYATETTINGRILRWEAPTAEGVSELMIANRERLGAFFGSRKTSEQLAQELELAKSQAADLGKQFNEEREKSAQRYFAGVEDCKCFASRSPFAPFARGRG